MLAVEDGRLIVRLGVHASRPGTRHRLPQPRRGTARYPRRERRDRRGRFGSSDPWPSGGRFAVDERGGRARLSRPPANSSPRAARLAAELFGVDAAAVDYRDGYFQVVDTNHRLSLFDLADRLAQDGSPDALTTVAQADSATTYPNGCHIAEVEIDPETGKVAVVGYAAVDDCGVVLDPALAESQVVGGVVQGIGQALMEAIVYDDDGQLLTGTFADYAMPRAADAPVVNAAFHPVPCQHERARRERRRRGRHDGGDRRGHERDRRCHPGRQGRRRSTCPRRPRRSGAPARNPEASPIAGASKGDEPCRLNPVKRSSRSRSTTGTRSSQPRFRPVAAARSRWRRSFAMSAKRASGLMDEAGIDIAGPLPRFALDPAPVRGRRRSALRGESTTGCTPRSAPFPIASPASPCCRPPIRPRRPTSSSAPSPASASRGAMIHGLANGLFLDDERFRPIFERAERLDVPIYLHPSVPHPAVVEAYYKEYADDFPDADPRRLGLHRGDGDARASAGPERPLRRAPQSEDHPRPSRRDAAVPARGGSTRRSARPGQKTIRFREIFTHSFYVTTSGFFSTPALSCCIEELGADRILFAVDYPYVENAAGVTGCAKPRSARRTRGRSPAPMPSGCLDSDAEWSAERPVHGRPGRTCWRADARPE